MTPSSAALPTRRPRRGSMALAGTVAAVLLVAAACSSFGESDGSDGGSSGGGEAAVAADSATEEAADGADAGAPTRTGSAGSRPAAAASLDITTDALVGRDIIRTGSLTVLTDDLTAARSEVAAAVARLGGVVASETAVLARAARNRGDDRDQSMQLSLQVPTGRFDAAMTAIAEVGRVQARSISTQDVTAEVADVDSRVDSARAALDRVRALLARANSLGTVISLEGVLSDRQADLEALLAQQRALQGQTQLATITLDLRVVADDPVAAEEADGFVAGLRTGWGAFTGVLVGFATVLGMLVPFAVLVAPLAVVALFWRRRRSGQLSPPPAT